MKMKEIMEIMNGCMEVTIIKEGGLEEARWRKWNNIEE